MNYELVVKAAWNADPQFVGLCKNLWGADVTVDDVISFSKDGPDASSVHVPGGASSCRCKGKCKCKGLPVMDDRGITKSAPWEHSPSYRAIPKPHREYKRDHRGQFAAIGDIARNAGLTTGAAVAGAGAGHFTIAAARRIAPAIAEAKASEEGRAALLRMVAGRGLGVAALGGTALLGGVAAAKFGAETGKDIRDHVELERMHNKHVDRSVYTDNLAAATHEGVDHNDLRVVTRGRQRDAVTHVFTEGANHDKPKGSFDVAHPWFQHHQAQAEGKAFMDPEPAKDVPGEDRQRVKDQRYMERDLARLQARAETLQDRSAQDRNAIEEKVARKLQQEFPHLSYEEALDRVHQHSRIGRSDADNWYVSKSDLTGQLTNVNVDKHQVFGWASIVEKDGEPVVDLQGDYIGIDELEKSAYDYVQKSRVGGAMHRRVDAEGNLIEKADAPYHAADLIESFVVTREKIEKMGLPENTPVGWWVGFKVNDPEVWDSVKSGDWKGFSIHGAGRRKPIGEVSDFSIEGADLVA